MRRVLLGVALGVGTRRVIGQNATTAPAWRGGWLIFGRFCGAENVEGSALGGLDGDRVDHEDEVAVGDDGGVWQGTLAVGEF